MGTEMLGAIGYAYVRQTQKVRGQKGAGANQVLGSVFEGVLQGAHSISEGASAVGNAVSIASALSK